MATNDFSIVYKKLSMKFFEFHTEFFVLLIFILHFFQIEQIWRQRL